MAIASCVCAYENPDLHSSPGGAQGFAFTFASNYHLTASFFTPGGHFNNDFGQLTSAAMLFAKFHAGTRKSLSDFWSPLPEQPTKFVLSFKKLSIFLEHPL